MAHTTQFELGPEMLGAETLVVLARSRAVGVLSGLGPVSSVHIRLVGGRPEAMQKSDGSDAEKRAAVVATVRAFAVLAQGRFTFIEESAPSDLKSLRIDTLGEVLVALLQKGSDKVLARVWQHRGPWTVALGKDFARIGQTLQKMGAPEVMQPASPGILSDWVPESMLGQKALLALLVLGGLQTQAPKIDASESEGRVGSDEDSGVNSSMDSSSNAEARANKELEQVLARSYADHPQSGEIQKIQKTFKQSQDQDHYSFLGIDSSADAAQIRRGYFAMAKIWHSDRFAGSELPDEILALAQALFRRADEANQMLSDPKQRSNYDWVLDRRAKGLPTDPKVVMEAEGLFHRGQNMVQRGSAAQAEPILRQAVKLNPGEGEFWVYFGFALFSAQGQDVAEEARAAIEKGLAIAPKLSAGYAFLGRIARASGEMTHAREMFEQALRLDPKNTDAKREMRVLSLRERNAQAEPKKERKGLLGKILGKD